MKKIILSLSLIIGSFINAQWTNDTNENTLLVANNNGASFSVATSDGHIYLGFWKKVAAPTNYELRIQYLDKNGNKLWGEEGKLISNQIPMSTYTMVEQTALDKDDNLFIGVTGTTGGYPAFAYKVTPNGDLPWGTNGIALGEGYVPTILPLKSGDIMISYWPTSKVQARLQKFTSAGTPIWAEPTIIYSDDTTKKTVPADLFELSNGNIEIVFNKVLTGAYSNLYAQTFDTDGKPVWNAPVLLSPNSSTWSKKNSTFFENDKVYYAFTSGQGGRLDSYLIKINPDGTLPWGVGGVDFSTNNANFEKEIQIASKIGTDHICGISTFTTAGSQNNYGEYVQKFDKETGSRLFSDNAKAVFPISLNDAKSHVGTLLLDDDKPIFAYNNIKQFNVQLFTTHFTRLNENGEFDWKEKSIDLITRESFTSHNNLLKLPDNQIVFKYNESRDSAPSSVYAQNAMMPDSYLATTEVNNSNLNVYPNPTSSVLNFSKDLENASVKIYNFSGQLVKSETIKGNIISVENLPKANYIIEVNNKGKVFSSKFIKN